MDASSTSNISGPELATVLKVDGMMWCVQPWPGVAMLFTLPHRNPATCIHSARNCGSKVLAALRGVASVTSATLDFPDKLVTVTGDAPVASLQAAVAAAGFTATPAVRTTVLVVDGLHW